MNLTDEAASSTPTAPPLKFIHWQLPPRLTAFTGRTAELQSLRDTFLHQQQRLVIQHAQKVSGTGGIGKTQLLVEFVHQMINSGRFSRVIWVNASTALGDQLSYEFRHLAQSMDLEINQLDTLILVKQIYKLLSLQPGTLIVFDNALNYESLEKYLPEADLNISVLVTSRDATPWSKQFIQLPLDIFTPQEALDFIQKTLPEYLFVCDKAILLATTLGNFPLALAQATAYIKTRNISIENYLSLYAATKLNRGKLLDRKPLASDPHQETVWVTVNLCLEKITDPVAVRVIHLSAYLAAEVPIDSTLLHAVDDNPSQGKAAILELQNFSLLEAAHTEGDLKIHQLVQEILRIGDDEKAELSLLDDLSTSLINHFDIDSDVLSIEKTRKKLLPHLLCVRQFMRSHTGAAVNRYDRKIAMFNGAMAGIYYTTGSSDKQIVCLQEALDFYEQHDPNNVAIIRTLASMAPALDMLGDHERSLQISQKALARMSQGKGQGVSIYPFLLTNNLGNRSLMQGDYQAALAYFQQAGEYATQSNLFESQIHLRPLVMGSKAAALRGLGELDEALELQTEALLTLISIYQDEHSHVAIALENMAKIYQAKGDMASAEDYSKQALDMTTRLYGDNHLRLARQLDNYGSIVTKIGQLDLALANHFKSEKIFKFFLGEATIELAVTYACIANCYDLKGDRFLARENYQKAKNILQHHLGNNHPRYAVIVHNLVNTYINEDFTITEEDIAICKPLLLGCLQVNYECYGPYSLQVGSNFYSLSLCYNQPKDFERKMKYIFSAFEIFKKTCGYHAIPTIKALFILAECQATGGDMPAALLSYKICYRDFLQILGPDHYATKKSQERAQFLREACSAGVINSSVGMFPLPSTNNAGARNTPEFTNEFTDPKDNGAGPN